MALAGYDMGQKRYIGWVYVGWIAINALLMDGVVLRYFLRALNSHKGFANDYPG